MIEGLPGGQVRHTLHQIEGARGAQVKHHTMPDEGRHPPHQFTMILPASAGQSLSWDQLANMPCTEDRMARLTIQIRVRVQGVARRPNQ